MSLTAFLVAMRAWRAHRAAAPASSHPRVCAAAMSTERASQRHNQLMLKKGALIQARLQQLYPTPPSSFLHHSDPYTLLIAVLLSAQTHDAKVNQVTPQLFRRASTPQQMVQLGERNVHAIIQPLGLASQKARHIVRLSHTLCEQYCGRVPRTLQQLKQLHGVGHKTASVLMLQAFNEPAFPVDTHIHRLACRWGCGHAKSVPITERNLKLWFPHPHSWAQLHMRLILFGREHCPARNHDMDACAVCSFAATDEARQLNRQFPNKFVPPLTHANPFSVRQPQPSQPSQQQQQQQQHYSQPPRRSARIKRTRSQRAESATTTTRSKKQKHNNNSNNAHGNAV